MDFIIDNLSELKKLRIERGMTIEELSKVTGVRRDIILAYEEGRGSPTMAKYNKLAEFFGWKLWTK